jgi:hypothetical protein
MRLLSFNIVILHNISYFFKSDVMLAQIKGVVGFMRTFLIIKWMQARFFGLSILLCVGMASIVTCGLWKNSYDDAFITYRCAHNLALGHGLAYNLGEAGSATTTPLLAMILAGLGKMTLVDWIPQWGGILSGLSLVLLGFFVLLHARRENQMGWGWTVMIGLLVNPFLPSVWGGETLLCLAFALGAFYFYFERRLAWAGVFCFLAFLTRGEGALPLVVMAGHSLYREKKMPWLALGMMGILLVAWWPVSRWVGAGFLPHTLGAKMAQMQSGAWGPFVKTTLDWYRAYLVGSPTFPGIAPNPIFLTIPLLALVGGVYFLICPRDRWGCLVIWLVGYMSGYSILSVPFYQWYAFPILFLGLILVGLGVEAGLAILQKNTKAGSVGRRVGLVIGGGVLLMVATMGCGRLVQVMTVPVPAVQRLYTRAGEWLKKETPPEATVGFFEIGYVGYYSGRSMVDPVGLVHAEVPAHVAQGDFTWAFKHFEPDYILLTSVRWQNRIGKIRDEPWFKTRYDEVARIDEPGYFDAPIVVYRKISAAP